MASMFLSSNVNNIVSLIITKGGEDFDRSIIQDNQCYVVMDDFSNLIQSIPSYINRLSQVQEIQNVGGIDYNIVLIANSKDEYEQISAYDQNKLGNYTLVVKKNYKELEQNDIQLLDSIRFDVLFDFLIRFYERRESRSGERNIRRLVDMRDHYYYLLRQPSRAISD